MFEPQTPLERGYALTRGDATLLNELAFKMFESTHTSDAEQSITRASREMANAHQAWAALSEPERQAWRDKVASAFETDLAAEVVGAESNATDRLHDLESYDCWCGPALLIVCGDHERDERCWKCESRNGLVAIERANADTLTEQVIVVHSPLPPHPED